MPVLSPGAAPYMIRISQLAASVKPSATLAAGAKARQLKAAGVKVFDFSLGEPDFSAPDICDAASKAAIAGDTPSRPRAARPRSRPRSAAGTRSSTAWTAAPKTSLSPTVQSTRSTPRSRPPLVPATRSSSRHRTG